MRPFVFNTTRSIICESGSSGRIGAILTDLGVKRAMVVTDPGCRAAGLIDAAMADLAAEGLDPVVFDAVVADPPEHIVESCAAEAIAGGVDGIVGLGGGSSLDVAKLVALLAHEPGTAKQSLADVYGVGLVRGGRLPLVQIPTTAGTGSEVTPISILTTGESEKKGVVAPQLLPDVAVLDAGLTVGLPRHVTAATGIDAMVHALEAYTSRVKKNALSDVLAREALRALGANVRAACDDGGNVEAREAMLYGSMLAGMAFANAPVAAVHALAYPIGSHFHVPHGLSNSLVLPHVMRFNAQGSKECAAMYAELAPYMAPDMPTSSGSGSGSGSGTGSNSGGNTSGSGEDDVTVSCRLADHLQQLAVDLDLETRLPEVGIAADDIELLATEAMKQTRLLPNNMREVNKEDAIGIYEAAL